MPTPTIVPVDGGVPGLFYDGKSHSVSGPAGHGKTWLVLHATAWIVANTPDAVVVFVDYEDDRPTFKFRLKALGVTREQARRVAYWRPPGTIMAGTIGGDVWLEWVDTHRPSLVGLDSVSKSAAACGLNDEFNPEFRKWDVGVIAPLDQRAITTIRIDHTGHDDGPGGPKQRTRGASSKLDSVTGVSYLFRARNRWNKERDGDAVITPIKCRCGDMAEGEPVAVMNVAVHDAGARLHITFTVPDSECVDIFRPTALMERVSRYLETHAAAGPASKNTIEREVVGKVSYVRVAVAQLVTEGYVAVDRVGQSLKHTLVTPYREADDPLDEHGQEKTKP